MNITLQRLNLKYSAVLSHKAIPNTLNTFKSVMITHFLEDYNRVTNVERYEPHKAIITLYLIEKDML